MRDEPAPPLGFEDGQLELLKWIALASMLVDHVGRLLLGHPVDGWVFAAGRLAFPLFAFVLAVNLARAGDRAARALRTARRLTIWCAVSVPASIWARGEPWLVNVLGTLALGAMLCWLLETKMPAALRAAAALLVAIASAHVEFETAGVSFVPAVYWACTREDRAAAVAAGALLLVNAALNASFGGVWALVATVAAVPLVLAVRARPVAVPRLKVAFYLVYPVHLGLIGAWRSLA